MPPLRILMLPALVANVIGCGFTSLPLPCLNMTAAEVAVIFHVADAAGSEDE
jgi:hypothetical protein